MAEVKVASPAPRKRGRPRTIPDDQEVPERRRKQLRVAQQAYRKRKETTISNLQTRVQELESGIEELSQSFLSFSNLLLEAQVLEQNPHITSALQKITQQCVALARQGCDDSEDKEKEISTTDTVTKIDRNKPHTPEVNLDFDAEIIRGNDFMFPEDPFTPSLSTLAHWTQLPPTPPHQDQPILPFGIVYSPPPFSFSNTTQPLPSPPAAISPSKLMQQGRWSLSHRLVRQCCQNGYLLLTGEANEQTIEDIFKAPLSITERNRMITSFYNGMHDEVGDFIEHKTKVCTPLFNARDATTPEQRARTIRASRIISEAGPGEYMDASGVQKYLEEKGVRFSEGDSVQSSPSIDYTMEINTSSFIKFLSRRCICVGSGPAFRRKEVDKALSMASMHNQWPFETRF